VPGDPGGPPPFGAPAAKRFVTGPRRSPEIGRAGQSAAFIVSGGGHF
jgi:hypothetical protein